MRLVLSPLSAVPGDISDRVGVPCVRVRTLESFAIVFDTPPDEAARARIETALDGYGLSVVWEPETLDEVKADLRRRINRHLDRRCESVAFASVQGQQLRIGLSARADWSAYETAIKHGRNGYPLHVRAHSGAIVTIANAAEHDAAVGALNDAYTAERAVAFAAEQAVIDAADEATASAAAAAYLAAP